MRALCLAIALLLLAPIARGAEYHVTTTGSGSACTLGSPCATIAAGLAVAGAGDTLWIHAGTYTQQIDTDDYTITGGSSWATRLRILAWPGDTVTLRPTVGVDVIHLAASSASYIEIAGLDVDAIGVTGGVKITFTGVNTNASHHIRIRDCEIQNGALSPPGSTGSGILVTGPNSTFNEFYSNDIHDVGGHGMYISTADNLIYDNEIHNGAQLGIAVYLTADTSVSRNRVLFNRVHHNSVGGGSGDGGILVSSGEDNEVRGNRSWENDFGIRLFGGDPPGHLNPAVDTIVADNYNWSNREGAIQIDPEATGTAESGNSTTEPATDYAVANNPYGGIDWGTILHCQSQHHEHADSSSKITSLSNAGYCAATAMTYSGAYTKNTVGDWNTLGNPNPDPGVPISGGWGEVRRWPPTAYGFPALPLNSLLFYLPGAEDAGLFASGSYSEHFYALGLTTYMEGAGCTSCGNSGSAVRTNNPLGLSAGQIFGTNQQFVDKATALGAMVTLNHPAGAPSYLDGYNPLPRAIEIFNGYHAYYDEESNAGNECGQSPSSYVTGFRAIWDHLLETRSARIWGVSVNDWTGPYLATGDPPSDCYPTITAANRDRGKLDVLIPSYDLASYLTAFDRGALFAVVENNATKSAYPLVTEVEITSSEITIMTADGDETITWVGDGAVQGMGASISLLDQPASLVYLRAEINDGDGRVVFTQPFELEPALGSGSIRGSGLSGGSLQ